MRAEVGRLAGELVADGPGRLRLPGFGTGTCRPVAILRDGGAGPASDLGPAALAFLRDLVVDPALAQAAALLHSLEAHRQDLRDALLRAAARAWDGGGRRALTPPG